MIETLFVIFLGAILACVLLDVSADTTVFKCGIGTTKTIGKKYFSDDPTAWTFMEIKDQGISFDDLSYDYEVEKDVESRNRRVVYGTLVDSTAVFPWIADISFKNPKLFNTSSIYSLHYCGGAIINEYFVVTAAHCLRKFSKIPDWISNLEISVGEYEQKVADPFEEHFDVDGVSIIEDDNQDVAIIMIKPKEGSGFQFNKNVQPVCLPTRHTPLIDKSLAVVGGWGATYSGKDIWGAIATHLYVAEVPLAPGKCRKGMLCTFLTEKGADSCSGDSGGPLVQNINGHYTLLGVLHGRTSKKCGDPNALHYYADIKYHTPWILSKMRKLALERFAFHGLLS